MDGKKTISKVIPEGELSCIWAEAGFVSYKLCDRNYECDDCPFDQVMRQKPAPASASASGGTVVQPKPTVVPDSRSGQDTLPGVVHSIFGGPFSERLPEDRFYSRGHVWVKKTAANSYRVGIDHYAAGLLDGNGNMVFSQPGAAAVKNNPCAWIICDGGTVAVQSPVDGKIRIVNSRLMESAAIVRTDPYESGWLSEITSEANICETCLSASEMEPASKSQFDEIEREIVTEFDARLPALGVTLMDGGHRPRNLNDLLGISRYVSVLQKVFSSRT
ncbi:MAG: hypothetical protein M1378_07360 [Bacteroidetes bacterium]|nr:hypothetical protein [Bacteroidota bacterium]